MLDKAKKIVVIGLGKTGLSCVRFLKAQGYQFVAVNDTRQNPPGLDALQTQYPDVKIALGSLSEDLINQAQQLVVSPGVSTKEPAIAAAAQKNIPIVGDIELFSQTAQAPIIAITGTNGKSTVTTLLGEMIKTAGYSVEVGGNLGIPVLDLLEQPVPDFYVLELSSFQLETTFSLKAKAAVVLNIAEDHLDRYDAMPDYLKAKQRVYIDCEQAVVNADQKNIWQSISFDKPPLQFSAEKPKDDAFGLVKHDGKKYLAYSSQRLFCEDQFKSKHPYRLQNALAALALGNAAGISIESMLPALKHFSGLMHRCQWVANIKEVDWYNDSKATNVSASVASIEGLGKTAGKKLIIIAGGQGKQQDFSPLIEPLKKHGKYLILMGEDAGLMQQALSSVIEILRVDSMGQAVLQSSRWANPGDVVLLAPACASFDMFVSFEHRGERFINLVKQIESNMD